MKEVSRFLFFPVIVAAVTLTSGCANRGVTHADVDKKTAEVKASAGGKPKIVALETKHDFGKVKEGAKIEHVFRVRNQGDGKLVIEKAYGS